MLLRVGLFVALMSMLGCGYALYWSYTNFDRMRTWDSVVRRIMKAQALIGLMLLGLVFLILILYAVVRPH